MRKQDRYALMVGIPLLLAGAFLIYRNRKNRQFVNWLARFENGMDVELSFSQQQSFYDIIQSFQKYGDNDDNKLAYILATAWHESRMEPVRECFAASDASARQCVQGRPYDDEINGHVYYGRGLVQLTWLNNYQKMQDDLGHNLVNHPDLALNSKIAADILVYGMMNGSFTGKSLGQYIHSGTIDFYNARRVVNGTDKAALIAGHAQGITDGYYLT